MINSYCLYYIPKNTADPVSDMLMVFFGENKLVNKREKHNEIIILKNNDEVLGYVIMNLSSYCKIKINGTIFLPNDQLIDLINDILINNKLDTLSYKENSGYIIGKIIDKKESNKAYVYDVDIKNKILKVESTFDIALDTLVVVAPSGTYLAPGRMIASYKNKEGINIEGRIVTYEDLQMEVENPYLPLMLWDNGLKIGEDFFLMEEKSDA